MDADERKLVAQLLVSWGGICVLWLLKYGVLPVLTGHMPSHRYEFIQALTSLLFICIVIIVALFTVGMVIVIVYRVKDRRGTLPMWAKRIRNYGLVEGTKQNLRKR